MPLGNFERELLQFLAGKRSPDSYVGGATVLHQSPDSPRTSEDVDIFHDVQEAVEECANADIAHLRSGGYGVDVRQQQSGFVRARISREESDTKFEWVCDSAFRFFPTEPDVEMGWRLNFWDAATNKLLAFVGRMKLRDYLDVLFLHEKHLHVGALAWAAAGKDPGYSPERIISQGGWQTRMFSDPAEGRRIATSMAVDLVELRGKWAKAAHEALSLFERLPPSEMGCFYLDGAGRPVCPDPASADFPKLTRHFGSVRGAWPQIVGGA